MTSTQWPETRDGKQSSAFKVALSRRFFLFFFFILRSPFYASFVNRLTRLSLVMEFFIQFEMDLQ